MWRLPSAPWHFNLKGGTCWVGRWNNTKKEEEEEEGGTVEKETKVTPILGAAPSWAFSTRALYAPYYYYCSCGHLKKKGSHNKRWKRLPVDNKMSWHLLGVWERKTTCRHRPFSDVIILCTVHCLINKVLLSDGAAGFYTLEKRRQEFDDEFRFGRAVSFLPIWF